MSRQSPPRILMITPLAYDWAWNNRDHNMIRCFNELGCSVTHIYKSVNRSARFVDLLKDSFTASTTVEEADGVRLVRVDPFFNYFAGLAQESSTWIADDKRGSRLRGRLLSLLYPLRVLRDAAFAPAFVTAALLHAPGRYDVCIGFGPWGALAGWILRALGRAKLLLYEDQDYEPGLVRDKLRQGYTRWLEQFTLKRSDLVVSVGQRLLSRRQSETGKRVELIPNGVDWDRFEVARQAPRRGPVMVYTGNLVPWSGLELAIGAMASLRGRIPEARLEIIGDGLPSYVAELKAMVSKQQLDSCVSFLGSRPNTELPRLMAGAAVGLANSEPVPYRQYAYPLKVVEYMAAGLAVIGTEGTETEAIVQSGECGLAVEYSSEAVAAAALRLFEDTELLDRLRLNAAQRSATMTWESLMERELFLIQELLSRDGRFSPGP